MDDALSTNRIYDYEDIDWAESRSKRLHDPLLMANVKDGKKKKDGASSLKIQSMKYVIKQIPTHCLKFGPTYSNALVEDLKKYMNVEVVKLFTNFIFGPYLDIHTCNYQGQLSKCLFLLEINQDNNNELHIRHANENILRFTIKEFAIITG
ncbi:hypothetical protein H5410_032565 [Solanum commersonii]|uniref:Uncharacterized protein n=1 Tax=Solanum commersonii TaxID=4109 RepID=A0A9J5YKA1_SOLCO|nr:hypothetical protein H5410_032565 [Solanum commersonii]